MHRAAASVAIFGIVWLLPLAAPAQQPASNSALERYTQEEKDYWSFHAAREPVVPTFTNKADRSWIANPIDAFVLAKLKHARLQPAPAADRRTLVRRLSFDLTGLPPTPAQVEDFVNDATPDAYNNLVSRLLESPHYGERSGQHWLDVVRYAETEGFEYDRHHANAWRFRDYVIRSFNDDKPYDQFVTEQLAGDEIARVSEEDIRSAAASGHADKLKKLDPLIATGFHRLGPVRRNAGNAEVAFSRNEVLTETTDMIGSAFLGLSLGCARCHDHFYDPIRQRDYYRLQAFLAATYENDIPLTDTATDKAWKSRTAKINAEIEEVKTQLAKATGEREQRLRQKLKQAEERLPKPLPSIFSVRNDDQKRTPIHLLTRGDETKKQERLGMRFLGVLVPDRMTELPPDTKHPKTILAKWIASPHHPLTARVMVNRIWQHHFGQGLVATPNDFGANGEAPSHPELLDFLATQFIKSGWSIKSMHQLILKSNTYRQSSRNPSAKLARAKDPENRLLWHFKRRRLDAEEIRDAMLAISGMLNRKVGGPSVIVPVEQELIDLLYKPSQWEVTPEKREHYRRSIYLLAKRNLRLPFLDVFDQPDLQTSCACRVSSTHPPQTLELLNGKLANELAQTFAERLQSEAQRNHAGQIELAFHLVTGRGPTEKERTLALRFVETQPLSEFALTMFNLNAFLYVN